VTESREVTAGCNVCLFLSAHWSSGTTSSQLSNADRHGIREPLKVCRYDPYGDVAQVAVFISSTRTIRLPLMLVE
jgi:hypothetical protein